MHTQSSGLRFIGYGATVQCPNCHNRVVEQLHIRFLETGLAFIPIWTDRGGVQSICHICHTVLNTEQLLPGESGRLDVRLKMNFEATLGYAKRLTWLQRRTYINDLRSLGLGDFGALIQRGCA